MTKGSMKSVGLPVVLSAWAGVCSTVLMGVEASSPGDALVREVQRVAQKERSFAQTSPAVREETLRPPATPAAPPPPPPPKLDENIDVEVQLEPSGKPSVKSKVRKGESGLALELERVERNAKDIHDRAVREAQRMGREAGAMVRRFGQAWVEKRGDGGGTRILIVPDRPISMEDRKQLHEDLRVMHRIFSRITDRSRKEEAMFPMFGEGRPNLDALRLEGYGVVFFLSTDLLLAPAAATAKSAPNVEASKDEVWEKVRRSVQSDWDPVDEGEAEPVEFDGERVERLKTRLVQAFKHAGNIRGLKPEEKVVVVVQGNSPRGTERRWVPEDGKAADVLVGRAVPGVGMGGTSPTLTFEAKKSEIDSIFAEKAQAKDVVRLVESAVKP